MQYSKAIPRRGTRGLMVYGLALTLWACEAESPDSGVGPSQIQPLPSGEDLAAARPQANAVIPTLLPQSTGSAFHVSPTGSDANPGTAEEPWQTIQMAMTSLQPGQIAYVRAGTYETGGTFGTEADRYLWTTACQADAPCSLVAFPGERPILHGQVRIAGSYLRLSGFIIEGPLTADPASPTARRANQVWLNEAHHVEFSGNEVRYNDYHAGVKLDSVNNVQLLGNYIHDNGRFNLTLDPVTGGSTTNTDQGIYWASTNGDGNLIANNLIEHNRAKGIQLYENGTYDVVVTHNTVIDNGSAGIILSGKTDRITVANNVVGYNNAKQIRVLSGNSNLIVGNLVYSPKRSNSAIENKTKSSVQGTITADPRFVNQPGHDFHLQANSPAVDRAVVGYAMGVDLEGTIRPVGAGPDVGAYER